MNFKKLNIIVGWAVFAIASLVYIMTIEPTASFWDCGEFIATAYKLEVGHPPGAPFFMILARFFMIFNGAEDAAYMTNILSALCSSFTILFLFWTITAFAKKMAHIGKTVVVNNGQKKLPKGQKAIGEETNNVLSFGQIIAIIGSGLVGALAYTFSDSFWFSAVEGEVYAMSSLFTAVVFWAIIKWDSEPKGSKYSERWIILIAYLMGLSIGVHLLGLLCIPAIALVYYLKNHELSIKGLIITGVSSVAILVFIQSGIIPGLVKMACGYEVFFTNNMGTSFNIGSITLAILAIAYLTSLIFISHNPSKIWKLVAVVLAVLLLIPIWGNEYQPSASKLWMTLFIGAGAAFAFIIKEPSKLLNIGLMSLFVILLGYSTFAMIVIRSSANPPMDENNPENVFTLLSYLNREQYGDRPLFKGQHFNANEKERVDGTPVYFKSYSIYDANKVERRKKSDRKASFNNRFDAEQFLANEGGNLSLLEEYIISDDKKKSVIVYNPKFTTLFPRMYSSQANHIPQYLSWGGIKEKDIYYPRTDPQTGDVKRNREGKVLYDRTKPKKAPTTGNNIRFFKDYQLNWMYWRYFMWNFAGRQNDIQGHGGILDGNWLSGVNFIDRQRLGSQDNLPESMTRNKGYNKFYFIPFIFGLIGLFYQLFRDHRNWLVIFLLFLLTGVAIVIYLNQYPMQPRERDYAFVGSFYAFAMWIGLGVFALFDSIKNLSMKQYGIGTGIAFGLSLIFLISGMMDGNLHFGFAALYISFISFALFIIFKMLGKDKPESPSWAYLATAIGLVAPMLMATQGWDDHNRSKRETAVDFASNYLNSCEENAILFTNGDNDTFPLWYAQEVEGERTDVRVMNLSLSNTDWYIDQMKRKAYESDPVPFTMREEMYRQGTRDVSVVEEFSYLKQLTQRGQIQMTFKKNVDSRILAKAEKDKYLELSEAIEFLSDDKNMVNINGSWLNYLPTRTMRMQLDKEDLLAKGVIQPEDTSMVEDYMEWKLPGSNLVKNNMMMLDMLSTFNWERPVYYAVTTGPDAYVNLDPYFELEGLAYRLTPKKHEKSPNPNMLGGVNTDNMYNTVMNKFKWGNMDIDNIYLDENNLRMTTNLRLHMANLAEKLIEEEKDDQAKDVLDLAFEKMPEKNVPFNQVVIPLVDGYYSLGEDDVANEISRKMLDKYKGELDYYASLDPEFSSKVEQEIEIAYQGVLRRLGIMVSAMYPQDEAIQEEFQAAISDAANTYAKVMKANKDYRDGKRSSKIKF
ncbi:MAG: DUF2723 domain-containing protein [Flavobacteriales bacterium]|nr:DUF2723 domain-containing protein [Flavobacteriales bacterium]